MAETYKFFATTAKAMEALLAEELKALGATAVEETRAGVFFEGPLEIAYRACLWSRIANRILLPLKKFDAAAPEKLYAGLRVQRLGHSSVIYDIGLFRGAGAAVALAKFVHVYVDSKTRKSVAIPAVIRRALQELVA